MSNIQENSVKGRFWMSNIKENSVKGRFWMSNIQENSVKGRCWVFKTYHIYKKSKSWNTHRNIFHASDLAIRPYIYPYIYRGRRHGRRPLNKLKNVKPQKKTQFSQMVTAHTAMGFRRHFHFWNSKNMDLATLPLWHPKSGKSHLLGSLK